MRFFTVYKVNAYRTQNYKMPASNQVDDEEPSNASKNYSLLNISLEP